MLVQSLPFPAAAVEPFSTKWRLNITDRQSLADTTVLFKIEMLATTDAAMEGTADECVGGAATALQEDPTRPASFAFDAGYVVTGSSFWSTTVATLPMWIQYERPTPFTVKQVVLWGHTNPVHSPTAFDVQYWDENAGQWKTYWSVADTGTWQSGTGSVKYCSINGDVWEVDNQNLVANSTSYTDPYATMGIHVTPTADLTVKYLTVDSRVEAGASYQPVIYQVNPANGAFIAEVATGPVLTFGAQVQEERHWPLNAPVTLIAGNRYVLGLRRTSGTGTSNAGLRFRNAANSFVAAPLTINGNYSIANKGTPAAGAVPGLFQATATVWTIGVVYELNLP